MRSALPTAGWRIRSVPREAALVGLLVCHHGDYLPAITLKREQFCFGAFGILPTDQAHGARTSGASVAVCQSAPGLLLLLALACHSRFRRWTPAIKIQDWQSIATSGQRPRLKRVT